MPYAPNIQYDTTSLANGIAGASQSLAQGFREHSINQAKDREAQGIVTGMLQANPDLLQGADDKTQKLLEKFKLGETGLKDNIFLAGWAAMTQKGLEKKQEIEAQKLQLDQAKQQMAQQAAARQFLAQAQQAQGGATGPLNNAAFKQFMSPMAQDATALAKFSGGLPNQEVLARMQDTRETNSARAKGSKDGPTEVTLPSGAKVAFSPSTGAFSVLPISDEQLAKNEEAKAKVADASTFLSEISKTAEDARQTSASTKRIINLYKEGATSGFGQPTLTKARSALARFGLGEKEIANQQQLEQEIDNLTLERRRAIMKGTGQVSDYESKSVERAMASPNKTPLANIQILEVLQAISDRAELLERKRIELEDEGLSGPKIKRELLRMRESMPINVDGLAAAAEASVPAKSSTKAAPSAAKPPSGWIVR